MSKPDSAGVHAPPPFIYATCFLVGVGIQRMAPAIMLPVALRSVGTILAALGLLLVLSAIGIFVLHDTTIFPHLPTSKVVGRGPYRFCRNPMYVGMAITYLGVDLFFRLVWPLGLLPVAVATIHYKVILREEAYLERKFGDDYREYCRKVGRWLPSFGRPK